MATDSLAQARGEQPDDLIEICTPSMREVSGAHGREHMGRRDCKSIQLQFDRGGITSKFTSQR